VAALTTAFLMEFQGYSMINFAAFIPEVLVDMYSEHCEHCI
jgi:hypothetical protein